MKAGHFSIFGVMLIAVAGIVFILSVPRVDAIQTTTTIIGWLVPDGTHWNNGVGAFIFPIVGVGLFAGMGKVLDLEGDFGVTLILTGLTIGGALSMLSLNANSNNVLPFALVVIPAFDLLIWQWKGGG